MRSELDVLYQVKDIQGCTSLLIYEVYKLRSTPYIRNQILCGERIEAVITVSGHFP